MKQTIVFTVTILAGLSFVFLVPQWRLGAQEPPRFGENKNRPREEHGSDRPSRDRRQIDDHLPRSSEGGPMNDRLMRRFDEVIARLDRIEHHVGGDRNRNGYRPPHGSEHVGNEQRMRVEERRHHFGRPDHDYHTLDDEQMRHKSEMAEQAHRMHEEMRERLEDQMQHTREMMEQARERFIELNERVEELEEGKRELEERIEELLILATEMVEE